MQQSAVEWLVEKIKLKYDIDFYHIKNDIDQAKEMEKQQIMNAYNERAYDIESFDDSPEEYYNNTYKQ
jgi:hypothetical protein